MNSPEEKCIVCERSSDEVPLIPLHYQNSHALDLSATFTGLDPQSRTAGGQTAGRSQFWQTR